MTEVKVSSPAVKNMFSLNSPTKTPVSLLEVMDEQLASKLQEAEQPISAPSDLTSEDDLDEDLLLALKLSEEEANVANQTTNDTEEVKSSESSPDDDFLLALKLQNEIDAEDYARHMLEKERLQQPNQSKVSTSYYTRFSDNFLASSEFYDDQSESDSDDDFEEDYIDPPGQAKQHHQAVKTERRIPAAMTTKHDPILASIKNVSMLENRLESGSLGNLRISTPVYNSLVVNARKQEQRSNRVRGNRLDIATSEQVMDQRTRVKLLKLLNADVLRELNGIVNTGKEANVYHAVAGGEAEVEEGSELAVKIFKTTLNEFKNRSEYVEGEFRFRRQSLENPRKLIRVWAEKETRNLKRLRNADIPCPTPLILKENILVMTFLGKKGHPAPLLKDAKLSLDQLEKCYRQIVKLMRRMYHDCRLVHADLSEYNIIYSKGQLWIIDVSQAVEHYHPRALEFLKKDCQCIVTFFQKKGVADCMTMRDLFNFVTDPNLPSDVDPYLDRLEKEISQREDTSNEDQVKEAVFENSFTPRTLGQVQHPVAEIFDNAPAFHQSVTGLTPPPNEN